MKQWNMRITKYADRLLKDLEELDWPKSVKEIQKNWIGKSEGSTVSFKINNPETGLFSDIEVFTTRPDTIFGVTYLILSPEHKLVNDFTVSSKKADIENYRKEAERKSDMERTELSKNKTGEFTGSYAIHPVTDEKLPVLISDYVLVSYGTGAIMGVPGHDERDNEFARKYSLKIIPVLHPEEISNEEKENFIRDTVSGDVCFSDEGISINSDFLNGLKTSDPFSLAIHLHCDVFLFSMKDLLKLPIRLHQDKECPVQDTSLLLIFLLLFQKHQ